MGTSCACTSTAQSPRRSKRLRRARAPVCSEARAPSVRAEPIASAAADVQPRRATPCVSVLRAGSRWNASAPTASRRSRVGMAPMSSARRVSTAATRAGDPVSTASPRSAASSRWRDTTYIIRASTDATGAQYQPKHTIAATFFQLSWRFSHILRQPRRIHVDGADSSVITSASWLAMCVISCATTASSSSPETWSSSAVVTYTRGRCHGVLYVQLSGTLSPSTFASGDRTSASAATRLTASARCCRSLGLTPRPLLRLRPTAAAPMTAKQTTTKTSGHPS
jgi:hypothetical protein